MFKSHDFQKELLGWYDGQGRDLPWRSKNGVKPDPYHVWLSEIMLQQTTVTAVIPYFLKFTGRWPGVTDLADADPDEVMSAWAGLGYYARARNLLKCATYVGRECGGTFPQTAGELAKLPGIGPYTSAAIAAIAFNEQAVVVDGNIERVTARIFAVQTKLPAAKPILRKEAEKLFAGTKRPGDLAQALMDHGSAICIPKSPRCSLCPVRAFCEAYRRGMQNELPMRETKSEKPKRAGRVYALENERGEILLIRRSDKRMLGGMLGLPTTGWEKTEEDAKVIEAAEALNHVGDVYHSFTHFDLKLEVWTGRIQKLNHEGAVWRKRSEAGGLPSLFMKAVKLL